MIDTKSSFKWVGAGATSLTLYAASGCGSEEAASPRGGQTAPDAAADALPDGGPSAVVVGQPDPMTNQGVRTGLNLPNDCAIVGSRLLVVDQNNSRVLIWNAIPTRNNQPSDLVIGQPDFTTSVPDYGGVSARGFRGSNGVASDGTRLVVADRFNFRVLIWNTFPTTNFQPADVVLGQPDFTTSGSNTGGISARSMTEPWAWLGGGKLFVSDRNNFRVLIWNTIPTQNHAPADVVLGQPSMTAAVANNGGVSASSIADPGKGWVDADRLFVPDLANHRVLVWNSIPTTNNAPADRVLGQSTMTTNAPNAGDAAAIGAVGFNGPISAFAMGSTLAVSDYTNNRVLIWSSPITGNGQPANLVLGQQTFSTNMPNSGGLNASSLNTPNSVCGDASRLVISDRFNHRVLLFSPLPTTSGAAASLVLGQPDFVSGRFNNPGPVSRSNFVSPQTVARVGAGLAVADFGNDRVLLWDAPPSSAGAGASIVLGQPDFSSFGLFGGVTSAQSSCGPWFVHGDDTRLVVGEQCARRVTLWSSLPTATHDPADLAVGQPDLTSSTLNNGGISARSLAGRPQPHLDGQRLFVADGNNHRVLIWNAIPQTSGSAADLVLGQPDMTSATVNNGGVSARSLAQPGFVYTSGGKLFVADSNNHRLLVWNAIPSTNQAPADLVLGQPDMSAASESAPSARTLRAPRAVHVDADGRLYVVDTGNHRILYWNVVPTQNQAAADGVVGQPDLNSGLANNGGLSGNRLQSPGGLLAIANLIYVADSGNNRLVILPRP